MSTAHILQRLLNEGRLFELPSLFSGFETARTVIVSCNVLDVVTPPFPSDERSARFSEFRQVLDAFSEGGEFSVAEDPSNKPYDAMMARVYPVEAEFFSLRITDPEATPGIRCLGAFADKDTFIALVWDFRENILLFDDEVEVVRAEWRHLFGDEPPHSGERLDDYLSNYFPV
jgi:hypothetical protein